MQISIRQTNLSSLTLEMIERTASVLADNERQLPKIESVLLELSELAFTDGRLATGRTDYSFDLPSDVAGMPVRNGRISEELN